MMMGENGKEMSFKERMEAKKKAKESADKPAARIMEPGKAAPEGPVGTPGTEKPPPLPRQPVKEETPVATGEEKLHGRVAEPIGEPSVVLDSDVMEDIRQDRLNEKGKSIERMIKNSGGVEKIVEKMESEILDARRRNDEISTMIETILESSYDKKWDDAHAFIRAIDDPSTRAEKLINLATKQRTAGLNDATVKATLEDAVKSAGKDSDADDAVKALIKISETMVEFDMKPEAKNVLREAKSINQYKVRKSHGKKRMKYNDSKIRQVAQDAGLGDITVPPYKKIWRYGKRIVAGVFGTIAAGWLILEALSGITGVAPRDLLVKAGILKEKAAEVTKYASEESLSMLDGRVGIMGGVLETDSTNGYPTVMPPEVMELRKKEKEYGKDYETLKGEDIRKIEKQLKKETDMDKRLELENELAMLKLGKMESIEEQIKKVKKNEEKLEKEEVDKKIGELQDELDILNLGKKVEEEAYNLEKMKFSTKPIPDILAELESAEKALGKDYATVRSETGEEETPEKQALKLLVLELGEKLDNRMKLEKFIFEEKIRRNITAENYCGNTVVGVDTNKPDEYPTRKVCDIIKWNVVDGKGNLLEVTVYDDHISCSDDCKGKKGKTKEKETDSSLNLGANVQQGQ
jgi:hypothetical protein